MDVQLGLDGSQFALIENAKELVKGVMADNPTTRDNDFDLIFETWELQGVIVPPDMREKIKKNCYTPETITRARRDIQNTQRQLQASAHVQIGRGKQEEKYHTHFRR